MTGPAPAAGPDRAAQIGDLLTRLATLLAVEPATTGHAAPVSDNRVLFTVDEAAEQLGIGRTTAYTLVRSGALESVLIGRLRRIHRDSIAAYARHLVANHAA